MKILYIDEAGCLGALPHPTSEIQPLFVLLGMTIDANRVPEITQDFMAIKRRYFPRLFKSRHKLDDILVEVKGSDVRRNMTSTSRNTRRAAFGFMDQVLTLIEAHEAQVFGRMWTKNPGDPFNGRSVYTYSIQHMCQVYQTYLHTAGDVGWIIADSRHKGLNSNVSHSIFTKKYKARDEFPSLIELPLFGHSDNHAVLQIVDLITSALLFPIGIETYCAGHITNVHTRDYAAVKTRYCQRLADLQFRFRDRELYRRGGVVVSDAISQKSGAQLFRP